MSPNRRQPPASSITDADQAVKDVLGLFNGDELDYARIATLANLTTKDLSNMTKVSKAAVRLDQSISPAVADRLREIANLANMVAEYFEGDANKVKLWFELANPALGNVSPSTLIRSNRHKQLRTFVLDARDTERAASQHLNRN